MADEGDHINQMPPLPERVDIPVQLLEHWATVPANERITAPLTRQDIDNLIFGLLRGAEAFTALDQTLVNWSNGQVDEANKMIAEARRLNVESQNNIRRFVTGLMVSALRGRQGGT